MKILRGAGRFYPLENFHPLENVLDIVYSYCVSNRAFGPTSENSSLRRWPKLVTGGNGRLIPRRLNSQTWKFSFVKLLRNLVTTNSFQKMQCLTVICRR